MSGQEKEDVKQPADHAGNKAEGAAETEPGIAGKSETQKAKDAAREDRLAEALRANLKRRKSAARERKK